MNKPTKAFTPEQRQEYEKLKFTVHVHNESAKKWAATLMEIKAKEYYLIEAPTWDDWVKKHCPWSADTVRIAIQREEKALAKAEDERLIAETTGETIIRDAKPTARHGEIREPLDTNTTTANSKNSSSPKPQAAPSKVFDPTGREVHPTLMEVWNRRDELTPLASQVSELKCFLEKKIEEKDPLFEPLHQDIIIKLKTVHYYLMTARLEYVCGFCQGKCKLLEQPCPNCNSTGLMTKWQWEREVPETLKKGLKK
jgi:hypothetical protein